MLFKTCMTLYLLWNTKEKYTAPCFPYYSNELWLKLSNFKKDEKKHHKMTKAFTGMMIWIRHYCNCHNVPRKANALVNFCHGTRVIFLLSCELAELNMIREKVWASQNNSKTTNWNKSFFFYHPLWLHVTTNLQNYNCGLIHEKITPMSRIFLMNRSKRIKSQISVQYKRYTCTLRKYDFFSYVWGQQFIF